MSSSISNTQYYQTKFIQFQKTLSKQHIEAYNASGKSFEKLKEELGVKELEFKMPPPITPKDLMLGNDAFGSQRFNYSYTKNTGIDRTNNKIALVPGMDIDISPNIKLSIMHNMVKANFNGPVTDDQAQEAQDLAYSLDLLIKYANDQSGALNFDTDKRNQVSSLLRKLGLDTNQPVTINETEFNTKDHGFLEKSGVLDLNFTRIPTYQMKQIYESYGFEFD